MLFRFVQAVTVWNFSPIILFPLIFNLSPGHVAFWLRCISESNDTLCVLFGLQATRSVRRGAILAN